MNQESQAVDSNGQIHAVISYVPGEQCLSQHTLSQTDMHLMHRSLHTMCDQLPARQNIVRSTVPRLSILKRDLHQEGDSLCHQRRGPVADCHGRQ